MRNRKLDVADIEPMMLHNQVLVLKVKVFQQDTANEIKRLIEEYSSQKVKLFYSIYVIIREDYCLLLLKRLIYF